MVWLYEIIPAWQMVGVMVFVFVIVALGHPYFGEVSVTPDAYQVVLDEVMGPSRP